MTDKEKALVNKWRLKVYYYIQFFFTMESHKDTSEENKAKAKKAKALFKWMYDNVLYSPEDAVKLKIANLLEEKEYPTPKKAYSAYKLKTNKVGSFLNQLKNNE